MHELADVVAALAHPREPSARNGAERNRLRVQPKVNGRVSLANIRLGLADTKMTVSVWTRNLFDTEYVYRRDPSNRSTLGDYGNFNEPRTFGIEASLKI